MDIVLFRNLQDSLKVKTKRTSELANCEISLNDLLEAKIDDQQNRYMLLPNTCIYKFLEATILLLLINLVC